MKLPTGYRLEWTGSFENQQRAVKRLAVIVPITLVAIYFLLFTAFDSGMLAFLILLNVPFAAVGGVLGAAARRVVAFRLRARRLHRALRRLRAKWRAAGGAHSRTCGGGAMAMAQAVREGAISRVRPVVMTAAMAALGLLPAALSHAVGAETSRPFATVIIGGLITATLLTLYIVPILYPWFEPKTPAVEGTSPAGSQL